jgi:hypothetical protein
MLDHVKEVDDPQLVKFFETYQGSKKNEDYQLFIKYLFMKLADLTKTK